jgi:prepilin-type processing-associated H-X9-DG protein
MKTEESSISGFSVLELSVVVLLFALLAMATIPATTGSRLRAKRISCVCNLKQIGLSFRTWALDNQDNYPMQVSITNHGVMELVGTGLLFSVFQVMSNELSTPTVLRCPTDTKRKCANGFTTAFGNSNLSYFVGIDSTATNPQMFLSGDRNITNRVAPNNGLLNLTQDQPAGWTEKLHDRQGNISLADGSVQQFSRSKLQEALKYTGSPNNRILLP